MKQKLREEIEKMIDEKIREVKEYRVYYGRGFHLGRWQHFDYPIMVEWNTELYGTKKKIPKEFSKSVIEDIKKMLKEKHPDLKFDPKKLNLKNQIEEIEWDTTIEYVETDYSKDQLLEKLVARLSNEIRSALLKFRTYG